MKKEYKIKIRMLFCFLLCAGMLSGESSILNFKGGKQRVTFRLLTALTGRTAGRSDPGNTVSSLGSVNSINLSNPASLSAAYQANLISVGFQPQLQMNSNSIYDINPRMKNYINKIDIMESNPEYPQVEPLVGQTGGVTDFSGKFGLWRGFILGLGFQRSLELDLNMKANGMSGTFIDSGSEDTTRVDLSSSANLSFESRISQMEFTLSKKMNEKLALGLGAELLNIWTEGSGYLNFEGIIQRYGAESDIFQSFNDPVDGMSFSNSLDDNYEFKLKARAIRGKLGISYTTGKNIFLDLVINTGSRSDLSGDFYAMIHSLGSIDLRGLTEEEFQLFDQTLLEPSKLTYTNRREYNLRRARINLPGKVAVAGGYQTRFLDLILSYEKGFGKYSVESSFLIRETGRKKSGNVFTDFEELINKQYEFGFKVNHSFKFGLNLKHPEGGSNFQLGVQLYLLEQILHNVSLEKDKELELFTHLTLPVITAGFNISLNSRLTWSFNLISFPVQALRTGLSYQL